MENMISNMSAKLGAFGRGAVKAYVSRSESQKAAMNTGLALILMGTPGLALAANTGGNVFCYIAQYFYGIVGTAALVVIVLWAIEHFMGVAKLHDLVIKVGVGAAMVVGGAAIVANSGLSSSCILS